MREKELLYEMDHPFIIKLLGTTQDEESLYFVFENCANSDLTALISERSKYCSFNVGIYYILHYYGLVKINQIDELYVCQVTQLTRHIS